MVPTGVGSLLQAALLHYRAPDLRSSAGRAGGRAGHRGLRDPLARGRRAGQRRHLGSDDHGRTELWLGVRDRLAGDPRRSRRRGRGQRRRRRGRRRRPAAPRRRCGPVRRGRPGGGREPPSATNNAAPSWASTASATVVLISTEGPAANPLPDGEATDDAGPDEVPRPAHVLRLTGYSGPPSPTKEQSMPTPKISIQLYSIHEALDADLDGSLGRLAADRLQHRRGLRLRPPGGCAEGVVREVRAGLADRARDPHRGRGGGHARRSADGAARRGDLRGRGRARREGRHRPVRRAGPLDDLGGRAAQRRAAQRASRPGRRTRTPRRLPQP